MRVAVVAVASMVLAMSAYVAAAFQGRTGAMAVSEQGGYAIGIVIGSLLLAIAIRYAWVHTGGRSGSMASHWTPAIAAVVSVVLVMSRAGTVASAVPPGDPVARAAVAAPYALQALDEATVEQIRASVQGDASVAGGIRSLEARAVTRGGVVVGYLVVTDAGVTTADGAAALTGTTSALREAGVNPQSATVHGHAGLMVRTDVERLMWVDPPYLLIVFASDAATAQAIADAAQP